MPLCLFRNPVFSVASAIGFIVGIALFGAVTYIPLYLQVVKGASPTASGPPAAAADGGLLVASIGSGQLITRFGRYKVFPIVGTALAVVGMLPPLASRHRHEHRSSPTSTWPCSGSGSASSCRCSSSRSRTPSTTRTSASRPRPRRCSARWAARSASRSSARSSPNQLATHLLSRLPPQVLERLPVAPRPEPDRPAAAGDPRPLHRRLGRGAPADLPDRRRDRGARVRALVVPAGAAAAGDRRRPGPRRQLRRSAGRDVARGARDPPQHSCPQAEPPHGLRPTHRPGRARPAPERSLAWCSGSPRGRSPVGSTPWWSSCAHAGSSSRRRRA